MACLNPANNQKYDNKITPVMFDKQTIHEEINKTMTSSKSTDNAPELYKQYDAMLYVLITSNRPLYSRNYCNGK